MFCLFVVVPNLCDQLKHGLKIRVSMIKEMNREQYQIFIPDYWNTLFLQLVE
jgi:hypothetical protein